MRYVKSRTYFEEREETYRIYVSEALKALAQMNVSYTDLFKPPETRTAEEIITSISDKLSALGGE